LFLLLIGEKNADVVEILKINNMENKLPKYWVVRQQTNNPNWEKVIDYINNNYNMSWLGGKTNYYYGYTGHSKHNGTDSGICLSLFKNNPTVLTIEAFMELTNQKPETIKLNKLPKYWVVERDLRNPDWKKVIDYLNRQSGFTWEGNAYNYYGTEPTTSSGVNCYDEISYFKGNPTVFTIEEFIELTNQKPETMVTIKRKELQKIHDIACDGWKQRIANIASGQPFGDIKLSQAEVDEMFKAATPKQLPVLENIFGKQQEELDFRVALDVKVDGLSLFGGLETSHTEAFIVLPNPINKGDKNKFYLNPNYNWELVDDELIVTRKYLQY
jgi:hypothetical protein